MTLEVDGAGDASSKRASPLAALVSGTLSLEQCFGPRVAPEHVEAFLAHGSKLIADLRAELAGQQGVDEVRRLLPPAITNGQPDARVGEIAAGARDYAIAILDRVAEAMAASASRGEAVANGKDSTASSHDGPSLPAQAPPAPRLVVGGPSGRDPYDRYRPGDSPQRADGLRVGYASPRPGSPFAELGEQFSKSVSSYNWAIVAECVRRIFEPFGTANWTDELKAHPVFARPAGFQPTYDDIESVLLLINAAPAKMFGPENDFGRPLTEAQRDGFGAYRRAANGPLWQLRDLTGFDSMNASALGHLERLGGLSRLHFGNGSTNDTYLRQCPGRVLERDGFKVAFAAPPTEPFHGRIHPVSEFRLTLPSGVEGLVPIPHLGPPWYLFPGGEVLGAAVTESGSQLVLGFKNSATDASEPFTLTIFDLG